MMSLEFKDALYYSDLMYMLKSLARFEQQKDEVIELRIMEREKSVVDEQEPGSYGLSIFQEELFEIVSSISKKAGVPFYGLCEISKYPELVKGALANLENKKNELSNTNGLKNNETVLVEKLTPSKTKLVKLLVLFLLLKKLISLLYYISYM